MTRPSPTLFILTGLVGTRKTVTAVNKRSEVDGAAVRAGMCGAPIHIDEWHKTTGLDDTSILGWRLMDTYDIMVRLGP